MRRTHAVLRSSGGGGRRARTPLACGKPVRNQLHQTAPNRIKPHQTGSERPVRGPFAPPYGADLTGLGRIVPWLTSVFSNWRRKARSASGKLDEPVGPKGRNASSHASLCAGTGASKCAGTIEVKSKSSATRVAKRLTSSGSLASTISCKMGGTTGRPPPLRVSKAFGQLASHRQAMKPFQPRARAGAGTSGGKAERKKRAAPASVPSGSAATSRGEL
mmetsp:Transcript_24088/g.54811  ORF Transcript_24088/g.54811 Transcript_24088/m.54811 type:complete len:218 (-) Transcript_24088:42-695(-)